MEQELVNTISQILVSMIVGYGTAIFTIGKYTQKIDYLYKDGEDLKTDIKDLIKRITICETKIEERTQNLAATLTKRKSPISLSEKGEEMLIKSGANKFVLDNLQELVKKIKEKDPKSAYDVQEISKDVIKSMTADDKFIPLKDYVYKEGIELDAIIIVMSIFLRDQALPLLNYKPEDVDKSDPAMKQ